MKLSEPQRAKLRRIERWKAGSPIGTFMPDQSEMRTIDALERRGLIEYLHRNPADGVEYNGYRLTEAGRAVL